MLLFNYRVYYSFKNYNRLLTNIAAKNTQDLINNETNDKLHVPVMLNEVLEYLVKQKPENKIFIDMTSGACGHTKALLNENNNSIVYALDRDPHANEIANKLKDNYSKGRIVPLLGKFSQLDILLKQSNVKYGSIDGALIDCGCSSIQFDNSYRGFSLSRDGPLDMRMGFTKYVYNNVLFFFY
jgi:16S rRNA C1402 N4-methylase RsmH